MGSGLCKICLFRFAQISINHKAEILAELVDFPLGSHWKGKLKQTYRSLQVIYMKQKKRKKKRKEGKKTKRENTPLWTYILQFFFNS